MATTHDVARSSMTVSGAKRRRLPERPPVRWLLWIGLAGFAAAIAMALANCLPGFSSSREVHGLAAELDRLAIADRSEFPSLQARFVSLARGSTDELVAFATRAGGRPEARELVLFTLVDVIGPRNVTAGERRALELWRDPTEDRLVRAASLRAALALGRDCGPCEGPDAVRCMIHLLDLCGVDCRDEIRARLESLGSLLCARLRPSTTVHDALVSGLETDAAVEFSARCLSVLPGARVPDSVRLGVIARLRASLARLPPSEQIYVRRAMEAVDRIP